MPESAEPFVDYFRSIAGELPDWDEYNRLWPTRASRSSRSRPRTGTGGYRWLPARGRRAQGWRPLLLSASGASSYEG